MPVTATQANPSRSPRLRFALRLVVVAAGLWFSGWSLDRLASSAAESGQLPGFTGGMVHGALMPMALPRLLLGFDVEIYAARNAGRSYKIGYTCGVNACGAVFFGLVYRGIIRAGKATSHPAP